MNKILSPVISNRKGYRIHSPFAFRLVTKVLFGSGFYETDYLFKDIVIDPDTKYQFNLLFRLLSDIKPPRVIVSGWSKADREKGVVSILRRNFSGVVDIDPGYQPAGNDFVVCGGDCPAGWTVPGGIEHGVWFIFNLQQDKNREMFENLKLPDNVRQTFELKNCGILIFDPRLQKQDFVINDKKSYLL